VAKTNEGVRADGLGHLDDPFLQANKNLADTVREYKNRLEAIEAQKQSLEKALGVAQEKLASAENDGAPPKTKDAFDLSQDDWAKLAEKGDVKYRIPCSRSSDWTPSAETLRKLGLAPEDAPPLRDAYQKSNQRMWSELKPLCAQAVGSAELAEKIGLSTCQHLVLDVAQEKGPADANEAMRQVAEMRAGLRPLPGPNDPVHSVTKMFLALTGENARVEADLAQTFGPEEAHRLAYADGLCTQTSHFGGPGPRKKGER
jgi:hypothetical protein